jgi:gas vesicle protein
MSKKSGFLKGLGLGALIAGVGALLFAPKSGKETREDIGKGFHEAKDQLSVGLDKLKEASVRVKDDSVKETKELMRRAEKLKESMNAMALKLSSATGEIKDELLEEAKQLMDEAKLVAEELETLGRKIGTSTKREATKLSKEVKKSAQKVAGSNKPAAKKAPVKKATSTRAKQSK